MEKKEEKEMTELETIADIYTWKLEQLYNYVEAHKEELTTQEIEDLETAKKGKKVLIHINYLIRKLYGEYPTTGNVNIAGKKIPLINLWDEEQIRQNLLRKIIIRLETQESILIGD